MSDNVTNYKVRQREFYNQNLWLQELEPFEDSLTMIKTLQLKGPHKVSLSYLCLVLIEEGKIYVERRVADNNRAEEFRRHAAAADFYSREKIETVLGGIELNGGIIETIDFSSQVNPKRKRSLSYVVTSLWTADKIIENGKPITRSRLSTYTRYASSYEMLQKIPSLKDLENTSNPIETIRTARELKKNEKMKGLSIEYIVSGLWVAKKITDQNRKVLSEKKIETFIRLSGAADYYDRHREIQTDETFEDPIEIIDFLRGRRRDDVSLSYLVTALWTAGKITKNDKPIDIRGLKRYCILASASDFFDNDKVLQSAGFFNSPKEAIDYLRKNMSGEVSITYLVGSLWTARKIPLDSLREFQLMAGAAEYGIKKSIELAEEIERAKSKLTIQPTHSSYSYHLAKKMDRTTLRHLNDDSKSISLTYLRLILKYAMSIHSDETHST